MKQSPVKPAARQQRWRGLPGGIAGLAVPLQLRTPLPEQDISVAVRHYQAGRVEAADCLCRQILTRQPREPDALHLRGVIAAQAGRFDEAAALIGQAIDIRPATAVYYRNLVNALRAGGKLQAAIEPCRRFLLLQPLSPEMHNLLGNLLHATGQHARAVDAFRQAVRLRKEYGEAWNNLGMSLAAAGQLDQAISAYRQSIALQPMPQTWNNLANALKDKGHRDEAIDAYRIAIEMMPASAEVWNNFGTTLHEAGRLDESVQALGQAVALSPDLASAHWNLALALLQRGDLPRGFAEYEWRWKWPGFRSKPPHYVQPQWRGEDISGKTILIHLEQGRGDAIQLIRYAPLIAARGGKVVLHCPPEIARLMESVPGVWRVISTEQHCPFDVHSPIMSLPHALGTTWQTIPANVPYIHAHKELARIWGERLASICAPESNAATPPRNVGLVWAGSPDHVHDNRRSIALAQLAALSSVPNVIFHSLQKGNRAADAISPPSGMKLVRHDADLNDFADTAALISQLDLVIAVDTAVAHLAGAMGKKVWVLIPFVPDWRWMSGRDDSPWYPTMRLFRQQIEGDWAGVAHRVANSLLRFEEP
jgi:tetratricopeptide (TPR) repeat protein